MVTNRIRGDGLMAQGSAVKKRRSGYVLPEGEYSMLVKCKHLMEGPGPSEAIVSLKTDKGTEEEVIVYRGLLKGDYLEVGPFIRREGSRVLIELPRESASGQWRIWVNASEMNDLQAAE